MRRMLVVLLAGCALACGRDANAQALGEAVQIDRQSMQGVGASPHAKIPLGMNGTESAPGQMTIDNADGPRPLPDCGCAKEPVFSVTTSALAAGTQVSITSPSPDAVIFYTTDGWTPTPDSTRYTGPVSITADTRLQAIAEEPQKLPSPIAEAHYTVSGPAAPKPQSVTATGGVLRKGTALRLVTDTDIASDTAQAGDHVALLLDEALMDGDMLVAANGTAVEATLTRVVPAGSNGKPGVLAFQVHSLTAHGVTIPLMANLTLAAPDAAAQAQHIEDAALVHVAGALPRGEEAEILPGMTLTAYVNADTALIH